MTHDLPGERPLLHFTAPQNWLNDPNGIIYFGDRYHLFYQHNPHAAVWSRPHWGHATSRDLLSWTHQPIALYPDGFHDSAGCYSGCCVDDDGTPTILYTAVREAEDGRLVETVGLATSDATLLTWTKHPEPVIDRPPPGFGTLGFRDPFVWKHQDGTWRLIVGSSSPEDGAAVLIYGSRDLRSWRYLGVLLSQHDVPDGRGDADLWECPQLVRLEDGDVLLLSRHSGSPQDVIMISGHLRETAFEATHVATMDQGSSWYAPHAFTNPDGRCLVFGWLREDPADTTQLEAGWAGALSLPRELYLDGHGMAAVKPAPEIHRLRQPEPYPLDPGRLDFLDLDLSGAPTEVQFELLAAALPLVPPEVRITADGDVLQLALDWPRPDHEATDWAASRPALPGTAEETAVLRLQMIIDGAIVEAFLDSARATAFRAHPWNVRFRRLLIRTSLRTVYVVRVSTRRLGATPGATSGAPDRQDNGPDGHRTPRPGMAYSVAPVARDTA